MTITEIAKMAGVSTATVSKVLNGKDRYISEETRKKILAISKQEGYIPNALAKSLKNKSTQTLGIIIPDVMNPFFAELARGVEDAAEKRGFSVILCNSDNCEDKSERYLQVLQEKMVDGIILTASEQSISSMRRRSTPLVLLDRDISTRDPAGRVGVDNFQGGYQATKHLIEKGCRNIGFISSLRINASSGDRLQGYRQALLEAGLSYDEKSVFLKSYSIETGVEGVEHLLSQKELDGLFCGNDLIAIGAMDCLKRKGLRVPEDIKVVGFDDIRISRYLQPSLTTVKQPIYKLGQEAVEMLVAMIHQENTELTRTLDTTLVERESC